MPLVICCWTGNMDKGNPDETFITLLYRALCMIVAAVNSRFNTKWRVVK